jgi:hypothetical protein
VLAMVQLNGWENDGTSAALATGQDPVVRAIIQLPFQLMRTRNLVPVSKQ